MLIEIDIRDFILIAHANISFERGMTVLTGETGAGKSLIMDALLFVFGERATTDVIRVVEQQSTEQCSISALLDITTISAAQHWLDENHLTQDDTSQCLLRRTLNREGRSRSTINGHAVTTQQLRDFAEQLLHLHSQHAQQQLLKTSVQGALLDAYLQDPLPEKVKSTYQIWQTAKKQLESLLQTGSADQKNLLAYQLAELTTLALQPDEIPELQQEQKILKQSQQLLLQCENVSQRLSEQPSSIISLLQQCERLLSQTPESEHFFSTVLPLINTARIDIEEAIHELQTLQEKIPQTPERLETITERLENIYDLARKHQVRTEDLIEHQQSLIAQSAQQENREVHIQQLQQQERELFSVYEKAANALSALRQKKSLVFAKTVTQHLQTLGMPGSNFSVVLSPVSPAANGLEHIQFFISTNAGQPPLPLAKVVSGGELSRVSLCIHLITASCYQTPIVVFDEVDIGVSGTTAEKIGELLKQLSRSSQIICITHLPQIAAQGKHHWHVRKYTDNKNTYSTISCLTTKERIDVIAQMTSGTVITAAAKEHARLLLEKS